MRVAFAAFLAVATAVALAFLVLPVIAIFTRVPPADLLHALGQDATRDALLVSLKTSAIAHAAVLVFGTLRPGCSRADVLSDGVWFCRSSSSAGASTGGRGDRLAGDVRAGGLLGDELDVLGLQIPFTQTAVVLAVAFVESPFYLRGAIAAFEAVDTSLLDAARTLGAAPARVFARIALPLAAGGLGAASALALARGLGDSVRRSSSPAACRASRRRCRSRFMRSSSRISTRARDQRALHHRRRPPARRAQALPWFRFVSTSRFPFAPTTSS
jgi:molybdate transport system permease protein